MRHLKLFILSLAIPMTLGGMIALFIVYDSESTQYAQYAKSMIERHRIEREDLEIRRNGGTLSDGSVIQKGEKGYLTTEDYEDEKDILRARQKIERRKLRREWKEKKFAGYN